MKNWIFDWHTYLVYGFIHFLVTMISWFFFITYFHNSFIFTYRTESDTLEVLGITCVTLLLHSVLFLKYRKVALYIPYVLVYIVLTRILLVLHSPDDQELLNIMNQTYTLPTLIMNSIIEKLDVIRTSELYNILFVFLIVAQIITLRYLSIKLTTEWRRRK